MREVVGAFIVKQQQVLLGRRSPTRALYPDVWDVFGGHIEAGESQEQALQRELYEELGIRPTTWEYIETLAEPDDSQYTPAHYHFYLVSAWEGEAINVQPEEHTYIQWFSLEDALHLDFPDPDYFRLITNLIAHTTVE